MNPQPNRFFQLSLVFLVMLNLIPHFSDYTVPTLAVGGLCLAWRLLYEYQKVPLPNFITKLSLVATLFYLVYKNYGQILGLESGSALLICAVSLKLIDRVAYRDAMVLLFLNFMLLLARFFESQSLGITIFAAFDLIITTALLVQLHNGAQVKFDVISLLKTGGKLFLQISPVMILLFFIFPRFSTGFLNARVKKPALDGFSDSMEPGSMSKLAQSEQMAFRVKFLGKTPSPINRYWRGGVLTFNNQMRWKKGKSKLNMVTDQRGNDKKVIAQEILLEPVFNKWLFVLDKPAWIDLGSIYIQRRARISDGHVYRFTKNNDKKIVYKAYSRPEKEEILNNENNQYLQSPEIKDERVLQLVRDISSNAKSNEQKAFRLMQYYQKNFRYTLEPGKLNTTNLDEFLFEKKVGFCEHFAVSFAALMRLADVPSRVVVGFLGGRKNEMSDYYMVTSKDAHAWTEIWSEQKQQWMRFDPTVMVAPLRGELGGDLFHSLSEDELLEITDSSSFLSGIENTWFQQAKLAVDAVATNWNLFLLNYDRSGQQDFFQRLGFNKINQSFLTLISLLILLCFYLWIRLRNNRHRVKDSPAQLAYLNFRARLSRVGIEKETHEGPLDFLDRVKRELPQSQQEIEEFQWVYLESYYGLEESNQDFNKLQNSIKIQ